MSEQPALDRPRRVTVAGVMAAAACVLLVLSLFDAMADVRSADTRDAIDAFLREPPGDGLSLGVDRVVNLLRGLVLLSGALAAAGSVLAVYTLRRHRGARVGLTVVAVLLLFSGTFVSGLLPVLVAVATTMLWSREARDWFDGRAARPAGASADSGNASSPGLGSWRSGAQDPSSTRPPARQPFGTPPPPGSLPAGAVTGQPGQTGQTGQTGQMGWSSAVHPGPSPLRRPAAVTAAVWLTWVFSALSLFFCGLVVLVMLAARDQLLEALQRDPTIADLDVSGQQILAVLWVFSAVTIFWSLAAIALAVLAFRRVAAGRIGLIVSAGVSGVVSVFAVPIGWANAIAAFTTLALLVGGSASRWYASDDRRQLPPPAGQTPVDRPPAGRPPGQPRSKPPVW